MKTVFIWIASLVLLNTTFAQNGPYSDFGHEGKVLDLADVVGEGMKIPSSEDSSIYGTLNPRTRLFSIHDGTGALIRQDSLSLAGYARWMSVDPARQYSSPYVGMGNNPVNGVDPDGRRVPTNLINSETGAATHIADGINQVKIVNNTEYESLISTWNSGQRLTYYNVLGSIGMKLDWDSELGIFSRILYAEMRGANLVEQESVANIIKNRVMSGSFPNTYRGVIEQKSQFSSLRRSDSNRSVYDDPYSDLNLGNTVQKGAIFANILSTTYMVYHGSLADITSGSLLYYSPRSMDPPYSLPKGWDFNKLSEVSISGVRPSYLTMYKNK